MRTIVASLAFLGCLVSAPTRVAAQEQGRPQILVLGVFHMANPGRDLYNTEVDDVLSRRRQQEMQEVLDVLRRFHPTKIAVEAPVTSDRIADRYTSYRAGEYTLTRNEIDQLGLRLADLLDHETVYSVDWDGDFPYYRVQNFAKANGVEARFDSLGALVGERVARESEYLRTHTLLETLVLRNADESVRRAVSEYYEGYMPFGQPYEYAGADLIASWFQRNVRIYHNIRALASSPDERILVIYGAGHLGWLRRLVEEDGAMQLRTLEDLLEGATGRGPAPSSRYR